MDSEIMQFDKRGGKVLEFNRQSDFFYRLGNDKFDKNDLVSAANSYRRALEQDPKDIEKQLALAEVLSEMERYDESSTILTRVLLQDNDNDEALFGLGYNFFMIDEPMTAMRLLEKSLTKHPDGEFSHEACNMLETVREAVYGTGLGVTLHSINRETMASDRAEEGSSLLCKGDVDEAAELLMEAVELDPTLHYARNNLSLALFCQREFDKALEYADETLKLDPNNAQALCNKLMVCHIGLKDDDMANAAADALMKIDIERTDEHKRACVALMELERYEDAFTLAKQLVKKLPYDKTAQHYYGMCAFELGFYDKAYAAYDKLYRIDYNDSIAEYYRKLCLNAKNGNVPQKSWRTSIPMGYQVPYEEMVERMGRMNELMSVGNRRKKGGPAQPGELERLFRWAFTILGSTSHDAIADYLAERGGKKYEPLLRDILMIRHVSKDVKTSVLTTLSMKNTPRHYFVYVDEGLIEMKANEKSDRVRRQYLESMMLCVARMSECDYDDVPDTAISIWAQYLKRMPSLPAMSNAQIHAFAGALEHEARKRCEMEEQDEQICRRYGLTPLRLKKAVEKLEKAFEQEEE